MVFSSKIRIGGLTYRVVLDPKLAADRDVLGECSFFAQEIRLAEGLSEEQLEETFLHEIIEAINNHCELELEHHKISVLAFQLHQVLRENSLKFGE